jgi:hypothetical protein
MDVKSIKAALRFIGDRLLTEKWIEFADRIHETIDNSLYLFGAKRLNSSKSPDYVL